MHAILVVDDNADSCKALAKLLSNVGDRAICFVSGALAIAYLRTHTPRLVILDVMMPGMDGMEVLRLIREDPRLERVPVVIYSAISDPEYIEFAKSRGATDFWVKAQTDFARLNELVGPYMIEPIAGNSR